MTATNLFFNQLPIQVPRQALGYQRERSADREIVQGRRRVQSITPILQPEKQWAGNKRLGVRRGEGPLTQEQ